MQKIIFTITILLLFASCTVTKQGKADYSSYQQDKENNNQTSEVIQTGERKGSNTVSSATSTQKKVDNDYNPYQHQREDYNRRALELMQEGESEDCEKLKDAIDEYYERVEYMHETKEHVDFFYALASISKFQCPEAYDFIKNIIKTDTSEKLRYDAILFLAQMRSPKSIPFLQEHLKKEDLSHKERFAVAAAFSRIGVHNNLQDIINEAIKILDELCYDYKYGVVYNCIWEYYSIGGQPALDFFYYHLERENSRISAAHKLAQLGGLKEYEATFPIFVEALHNGDETDIHIAIFGLAAIGTEEAFELIREQTKSENKFIASQAKWIFTRIDQKRRDKCKE